MTTYQLAGGYTVVRHKRRVYAYYNQGYSWIFIPPIGEDCKAFKTEREVLDYIAGL